MVSFSRRFLEIFLLGFSLHNNLKHKMHSESSQIKPKAIQGTLSTYIRWLHFHEHEQLFAFHWSFKECPDVTWEDFTLRGIQIYNNFSRRFDTNDFLNIKALEFRKFSFKRFWFTAICDNKTFLQNIFLSAGFCYERGHLNSHSLPVKASQNSNYMILTTTCCAICRPWTSRRLMSDKGQTAENTKQIVLFKKMQENICCQIPDSVSFWKCSALIYLLNGIGRQRSKADKWMQAASAEQFALFIFPVLVFKLNFESCLAYDGCCFLSPHRGESNLQSDLLRFSNGVIN